MSKDGPHLDADLEQLSLRVPLAVLTKPRARTELLVLAAAQHTDAERADRVQETLCA
jgi:hypothetical protein